LGDKANTDFGWKGIATVLEGGEGKTEKNGSIPPVNNSGG